MSLPAGAMLPSELERRQVFYTLKRWSSYTAWNRILGFYQVWADAIEKSLREASANGWDNRTSLPESDYVLILKGLAHCDDGVARLRAGDKRVFRCDVNGDFARASARAMAHWGAMLGPHGRIAIRENGIDEEHTPLWAEFERAGLALFGAWGECGPMIIEDNDVGTPTHVARLLYGVWLQEQLPKMTFPLSLPEVPDPTESVLVRTGKDLPCSGIWEPVEVPQRRIVSLFKAPPPLGPFPLLGCMNYLHGGTSAPRAKQETETESLRANVAWRLLWIDDRYADGSIPEEEKSYVFLKPEKPKTVPASTAELGMVTLESGQRVSATGRWLLQDDLFVAISLTRGDVAPLHEGRSVRWVLAES